MYGWEREREPCWSALYVTLRVSVQAAGHAFEPNVDPLAGFGLSIRDQRRTSSERPMENNNKDFPRIHNKVYAMFQDVSHGTFGG